MAKQITKYSIFLASPSDLDEEREAVEEVITELNLTYSPINNLVIELLKWETHSAPGISNIHPQEIINNDIGDDYDIFIGMIWKKFGTKTNNAESGTIEEFNNAIKKFEADENSVEILFYFKNATPKNINEIIPEDLIKIREFKNSISKQNILYSEFNSVEDFKNSLRIHIPKRINTLIEKNSTEKIEETITSSETSTLSIIENDDYGILDYSMMFQSLLNDSTISLSKISEYTGSVGQELSQKAEQITLLSLNPNPNKAIVNEIMKRTAKVLKDYSNRLETEIPIFYNSFEDAIKAGTNVINLTDDFYTDNTINELEEAKKSAIVLRLNTPLAIESMSSFYTSIKELPRIQVDINQAKKILMIQLEDLIMKLEMCLELTIDFSDAISSKIDKLKLKNSLI